ncbi:MAG TPA: hypothetical protein VJX74_21845, partial [Blastocatellia bacterium]|nr:hypothetical protein [Blastocatellia bacterium]
MAKGKKANPKKHDWEKKYKWRTELNQFLQDEREKYARLDISKSLRSESQKLLEKKESEDRAELGYLVRLLMRFHDKQKYTPPLSRLNHLFFLWLKERFERDFESLNFRKQVLKDKELKDKVLKGKALKDVTIEIPTDEATIDKEFLKYWGEHGAHIYNYFQNVLPKIEERLAVEFDSYEFAPGYKPASAQ